MTGGLAAIRLIAAREMRQRLRGKAFWIFTAMLCVAIVGVGVLTKSVSGDDHTTYDVAVIGSAAPDDLASSLAAAGDAFDAEVRISTTDASDAVESLDSGRYDAVIDPSAGSAKFHRTSSGELGRIVEAGWASFQAQQQAEALGLTPEQTAQLLQPERLSVSVVDPDDDDNVGRTVGTVSAVLLFLSINVLGGAVLTGVVEEKTTAVVEVLLARVRAHQLLAGKVAGIGVVGLLQFSVAVAAAVVSLKISGTSVPSAVWVAVPSMLFWFLGGFALYATLFALGGSFVSRQEDAQGAVMPISTFLTVAYVLMFAFGANPGGTPARILSVLPPFAPLLMPLRIATGSASVLEIAVAAVLLVAAVVLMLRLAGRIYAHTLLHRGSRLHWREALRAARAD
jgi:ABC-2 type transport system permease protein